MRGKMADFYIFKSKGLYIAPTVNLKICNSNLCSPSTKKNSFKNFSKTGKKKDWLKKPPLKNGIHFFAATWIFFFK